MLIVKQGNKKSSYKLHKCKNCGCQFIYDSDKEVEKLYTCISDSIVDNVECPCCEKYDKIYKDKVISVEEYETLKEEGNRNEKYR